MYTDAMSTPAQHAARILAEQRYANLSVALPDGRPWGAPVFAVVDRQLNFYWASAVESRHSQYIAANPRIAISCYDSTAPWGKGAGVYFEALAEVVTDANEIQIAAALRAARVPAAAQPIAAFLPPSPRRLYRATVQAGWINHTENKDGVIVDGRTAVDLPALRTLISSW